jgi:chitinase
MGRCRAFAALVVASALLPTLAAAPVDTRGAEGRLIIAYVFPRDRVIAPDEIAGDALTHINYAFANIQDGRVVEGFAHDAENFAALQALRRRHPHLKLLISVGGWTWSGGFSDAALTERSRRRFVASAVDFVRRHDLDGFDVDWEYPGLPGFGNVHRPEDRQNFTALMAGLRAGLDVLGRRSQRRYLLTLAAGADADFLAHTEMDKVQGSVDFVNLMTYDFREAGGDSLSGHHANLYPSPRDPDQRSAAGSVAAFLAAGVPAARLVLGVPFYGRAWTGVTSENDGLYAPSAGGAADLDTRYEALAARLVDRNGFARRWDAAAQAPWLWNAEGRTFVSYDDPESLRAKCRYIREKGLAGAMFWEYFSDRSGALLGTLSRELRQR